MTNTQQPFAIINKIQHVRTNNNMLWMDIVRVALKHAPEETKAILRQINRNDREISGLVAKLAGDE